MLSNGVLALIIGYLLGSIPWGYLLVKHVFAKGADIRDVGSGSIGATNVSRLAGLKGGVMTYLLDVGKGSLAVLTAGWLTSSNLWWMGAAGVMAIVGHMFPPWIGFRGGKGVATGVGVYLIVSPFSVASALALWGIVVYLTRYVSLGSIIAAAAMPLWIWLWDRKISPQPGADFAPLMVTGVICCALIIAKHHENIKRLLSGTENRISGGRMK